MKTDVSEHLFENNMQAGTRWPVGFSATPVTAQGLVPYRLSVLFFNCKNASYDYRGQLIHMAIFTVLLS